jgi:hypothetical protein
MIDLDATDLIASLSTGTYVVTRRPAAAYVDGIATPSVPTTFKIVAAVVPASGRDLLRLPEGRRSTETRNVYTSTPLYVGAQASGFEADLVSIGSDSWECQLVESWPSVAGYYHAIVQRAGTVQP